MTLRAQKTSGTILIALTFGSWAIARVQGQDSSPQPFESRSSDPQLKPNPIDALRKFEPAADEEYRLGRGDEITVDISGRPDLQAKLVIGPDGRISVPLAGEVMLAGLSRMEAAKALESALSPYYANLAVQVTITR